MGKGTVRYRPAPLSEMSKRALSDTAPYPSMQDRYRDMRTKLIRLAGILAVAALALGLGATVQISDGGGAATRQVLADNKGPASPTP